MDASSRGVVANISTATRSFSREEGEGFLVTSLVAPWGKGEGPFVRRAVYEW